MSRKRTLSSQVARHNAVYSLISGMRRSAGSFAERALLEGWEPVTVAWLYNLYDVLAEFETQARNLEDQGQLPL